jgi:ornithine cyclodeaminase
LDVSTGTFAEVCDGADIVCATTHADKPVVMREALAPGVHVTSVGYNPAGREVDSATVADALVVVESRSVVLAAPPSGSNDLLVPISEGVMTPDHIHAEIGELVLGTRPGRSSADQLTLYKSVGVAAQDVAAAVLVLAAARERGVGARIDL